MSDPLTGTGLATLAFTGVTLVGLASGINSGEAIAAAAGAVVFLITAVDIPLWKRVPLFIVSLVVGYSLAGFTAEALSILLFKSIVVDRPVGAVIGAAGAVRVLMMFSAKPTSNASFFDRFRGGGQ